MSADGPVVTVDRAAELLQCSRRRVFQLLEEGTVRRAQSYGRKTLVITESIYQALEVKPVAIIGVKPRGRKATAEFIAMTTRERLAASKAERDLKKS